MRQRINDLSRRDLLKLFGIGVGASMAGEIVWPKNVQAAQGAKITPRKTARNCIVIQNGGAPSPWECFDFKETKWTAKDLDMQQISSDLLLSKTLFPQGVDVWGKRISIVRSFKAGALVHFPAQYYTQAGRALNTAIIREVPALGSIVAKELEAERRESDTFPTYISMDQWNIRCTPIGSGMLNPKYAGLDLNTNSVFSAFGGGDTPESNAELTERWETLTRWSEVSGIGSGKLGAKSEEYKAAYDYGVKVLLDPRFKKALALTEEDKKRYGVDKDGGICKFGLGMLLARNILAADAGARFLWVANGYNGRNGVFDNHGGLYARGVAPTAESLPIYDSCPRFDRSMSALVQDLLAMPGHEPGKSMFDETLICVLQEFGRTPEMNSAGGRDHYGDIFPNVFMGGGIKAGRIIGKTDATGDKLLDTGWKHKQQPMMDHITSTIYSALGIDYSKIIPDTPSGRVYEYQQTAPLGGPQFIPRTEIHELFV
jgi:hypothetical protein